MISIVIPCYNSADTILKTINSLIVQDQPTEIILVDDASSDNTVDLIKRKYPNIKIINNNRNLGRAATRNEGLKYCHNKLILFLDSDVWLEKKCLQRLNQHIREYDIVYPNLIYANGERKHPKNDNSYPTDAGCFLVKSDKIKNLKFDENFKFLEDQDFFIKCCLIGLKAKYVPSARAIHQQPKLENYNSKKFFEEMSDINYGIKKHKNNLSKISFKHHFHKINLWKGLLAAVFNYNYFLYHQDRSLIKKITQLFGKHKKFEIKNIKLIKLYLKSINK